MMNENIMFSKYISSEIIISSDDCVNLRKKTNNIANILLVLNTNNSKLTFYFRFGNRNAQLI